MTEREALLRLVEAVTAYTSTSAWNPVMDALGQARAVLATPAAPELEGYGGLVAVARNAKEQGFPIHVATRSTCAEHLEQGDDKRDDFAFGQPAAPTPEPDEELLAAAERVANAAAMLLHWTQRPEAFRSWLPTARADLRRELLSYRRRAAAARKPE